MEQIHHCADDVASSTLSHRQTRLGSMSCAQDADDRSGPRVRLFTLNRTR
jgi:hypothetical protein